MLADVTCVQQMNINFGSRTRVSTVAAAHVLLLMIAGWGALSASRTM
jgi:hypothetical protein